ncbi:LamG domain-containing protein [Gulosibacter chungangensis]|uniref:Glycoside hydrolase family 16 protein n=1 Tax=Gulosibacter chungangensis TaxID=979746 RepID=A0A7J5BB72_9MICO|nr:hypothetical protein [Gulosibacter chungangensis]KAB1642714.1 hypothetical protein F8O05_09650 [Gulosibacter chungangensis]
MSHEDRFVSDEGASTIRFADRFWRVKASTVPVGPGPNLFSAANVRVDSAGRLQLSIARSTSGWSCSEVIGVGEFGYGTYYWSLKSTVLDYEAATVLGLFTWSDEDAQANRELDIEFSRWGKAWDPVTGSFAVQRPSPSRPAIERFTPGMGRSEHLLTWSPQRVQFRSSFGSTQAEWSYAGDDVATPGGGVAPRTNLWLFRGAKPTRAHTIVVDGFEYRPSRQGTVQRPNGITAGLLSTMTKTKGSPMSQSQDKNEELREERREQEEHRQELRDEAFEGQGGERTDLGSQDERRNEGLGRA